ncbi:MAG: hypothetical protein ACKPKO_62500, partial [Candidatus Fonsibacter sp.]
MGQQFHEKAANLDMGNSDQQLEWATGISNRAGFNRLMKPLKGVSEATRLQLGGRQPSGGGTVKVVLRPVRASISYCATFCLTTLGSSCGVFPATGLHNFKTVSR